MTLLLRPPGVYRAQEDTDLLIDVMRDAGHARGASVLDVGTGTGALALAADAAGARSVTAVDLSLRSVTAARFNSLLHGARVEVLRGDLFTPVAGRRFDLVVSNPPYVPAEGGLLPRHRMGRCWDAGVDGRVLLDRICAGVRAVLAEGGVLLLVQSALSGTRSTLEHLARCGMSAAVVRRARIPFGPVLRARAPMLASRGLIEPGTTTEELVVVEARPA